MCFSYVEEELLGDMKKFADPNYSSKTNMYYFMPSLIFDELISILIGDALLAIASFAFVFLYIRLCVGSWFLAIVGFLEIVLSIPISWFIFSNILRIQYFDGLNTLALYIVAAIGADDIFIFMDAYKQSAHLDPNEHPGVLDTLQSRMSWVYRRTGSAMAITSATTCAAFLCTLITPLANVQTFGIFAALVVFVDYVLVMTMFCTAVVIYHNRFEKPGCCCSCGCDYDGGCCKLTDPSPTEKANSNDGTNVFSEDRVTVFFRERVSGFIATPRNRLILGVLYCSWIIVAIVYAVQLRPVEVEEQFLPESNPLQKSINIINRGFSTAEEDIGLIVHFAFGVEDVDRSGVNQIFDPEYLGKHRFSDTFQFDEKCQEEMLNQCELLKSNRDLSGYIKQKGGVGSVKCFVEEFAAFNALGSLDDCDAFEEGSWRDYPNKTVPMEDLQTQMLKFTESDSCYSDFRQGAQTIAKYYEDEMGFDGFDVVYATISAENAVLDPFSQKPEWFVREQYDKLKEVSVELKEKLKDACGADKVVFTDLDQKFVFMNTQSIYVRSAITSSFLGVSIAFAVLMLSTHVFHSKY